MTAKLLRAQAERSLQSGNCIAGIIADEENDDDPLGFAIANGGGSVSANSAVVVDR